MMVITNHIIACCWRLGQNFEGSQPDPRHVAEFVVAHALEAENLFGRSANLLRLLICLHILCSVSTLSILKYFEYTFFNWRHLGDWTFQPKWCGRGRHSRQLGSENGILHSIHCESLYIYWITLRFNGGIPHFQTKPFEWYCKIFQIGLNIDTILPQTCFRDLRGVIACM